MALRRFAKPPSGRGADCRLRFTCLRAPSRRKRDHRHDGDAPLKSKDKIRPVVGRASVESGECFFACGKAGGVDRCIIA
jgi:hypothetical protein